MGNCLDSDVKSPSVVNSSSIAGTSSRTGSSTTTSSNTSSGTFGRSTGSGVSDDEAFPDGRILEVPNLRVFTFAELKAATNGFKPEMVLGHGGFGTVFKGWVDERTMNPVKSGLGMIIAVKRLDHGSTQGLEEWRSEVILLGRLSHPNLVRLLGYCLEDRELLLVYEFMAKGSLENHLFKRNVALQPLSWGLRLKIAIAAARGLAFLHTSEEQVIYRDFKAANILLDSNYNAKLSDFGLAKIGPIGGVSHITTRVIGTNGYAAPEYVATGHLYIKSDVYGFGVLLLELLSGQRVVDSSRPSGQHNLVDWGKPYLTKPKKLGRIIDTRLEGQYPPKGALQVAELTFRCLAGEPKSRPPMREVLETLMSIEAIKGRSRETRDASQNIAGNRGQSHTAHGSLLHPRHDGAKPGAQVVHRSLK